MTKKLPEATRHSFLATLAECGNQTLAAERVGVSRSWVCLTRANDAGFDAAVRAAVAAAKARLRRRRCSTPPPPLSSAESTPPLKGKGGACHTGWGTLDGAELVVRGSKGRRCQIGRARAHQWTAPVEARFLVALRATCNVKAACAEVGMAHSSAYAHRKRWRAFATAWDAAIEEGYVRIEAALLERGCNLFSDAHEADPDAPVSITAMTASEAIHLLHMHKFEVRRVGRPPGHPSRYNPRPLPELMPGIIRKLEAFARGQEIPAADRAADQAAYAARRGRR